MTLTHFIVWEGTLTIGYSLKEACEKKKQKKKAQHLWHVNSVILKTSQNGDVFPVKHATPLLGESF
jgi:hypothetical protein